MAITGIYKITSPTNKVYIGQSYNINKRVKHYSNCLCKGQPKLFQSIKKYGWNNHLFEVTHQLPEDVDLSIMNNYETLYWQQYKDCGFELMNVRYPGSNGKISEETKIKMRKPKPIGFGLTQSLRQMGEKRPEQSKKVKGGANPHAKATEVYKCTGEFIAMFDTQRDAANYLGIKHTFGISSCCRNKIKSHLGYIFKYA
jgi:hypothetical protein